MDKKELVRRNRRETLLVIAGLLAAVPLVILLFSWLGRGSGYLEEPYSRTEYVLDDAVRMVLYGRDKRAVEEAADAAFAEVRRLEGVFDRHDPASELAAVNRGAHAAPLEVSGDLFAALSLSKRFHAETGGCFDVTLGPVIDLWDVAGRRERGDGPPSDAEVEEALARCGDEHLVLDEAARTVYLAEEGMIVDLGGMAKGYAADAAVRVLEETGAVSGFVDMVSTTLTVGQKPREAGGPDWRVGVTNPRDTGSFLGQLTLGGGACLSSSGDYQRYFEHGGVRYHHIFDPSTGRPAAASIGDSVLVPRGSGTGGAETDILSTALFVMGYPEALEWAEGHGYGLLIVDARGGVHAGGGIEAGLKLNRARVAE